MQSKKDRSGKFENGQKKFDCVGSFGYAPAFVKFTKRIGGQK